MARLGKTRGLEKKRMRLVRPKSSMGRITAADTSKEGRKKQSSPSIFGHVCLQCLTFCRQRRIRVKREEQLQETAAREETGQKENIFN